MKETLLGVVGPRLASHPENLVTECLAYLLERSPDARIAVVELLYSPFAGRMHPPEVGLVETQTITSGGGYVDLVLNDLHGRRLVFLEAKFGAGLTSNQPHSYFKDLPQGGVLAVICPTVRATRLMDRCTRILRDERHAVASIADVVRSGRGIRGALHEDPGRGFCVVSWEGILRALEEVKWMPPLETDFRQFENLVRRLEEDVSRPLTKDDLDRQTALLMLEFRAIVDEAVDRLKAMLEGRRCEIEKGKTWGRRGSHARRFRVRQAEPRFSLLFSPRIWRDDPHESPTPFALRVEGKADFIAEVRRKHSEALHRGRGPSAKEVLLRLTLHDAFGEGDQELDRDEAAEKLAKRVRKLVKAIVRDSV